MLANGINVPRPRGFPGGAVNKADGCINLSCLSTSSLLRYNTNIKTSVYPTSSVLKEIAVLGSSKVHSTQQSIKSVASSNYVGCISENPTKGNRRLLPDTSGDTNSKCVGTDCRSAEITEEKRVEVYDAFRWDYCW